MTLKMQNKPQRLSTLPATLTFNDYSDYEGAPESSDFLALPYRLSTLPKRLWHRQTPPPGSPGGSIMAAPEKIGRPTQDTPGPPPAMPGPGPPPRRPRKPQDGSTGGRICKPSRCRNGQQRATGDTMRQRNRDVEGAQRHRAAAGRKKNKAG